MTGDRSFRILATTASIGLALVALSIPLPVRPAAQAPPGAGLHQPFDQLLDQYVRDGSVYYAAVKSDRRKLDHYVQSLDGPQVAGFKNWSPEQQEAFWLNAYNAFVILTVIDHYPIRGQTPSYPSNSIRQIPGAFDRTKHRVAGGSLTLDEIENRMLAAFHDPRLFVALGRGAMGSGRLRSEAYTPEKLVAELESVVSEFPTRRQMLQIDRPGNRILITPIVGWHQADFIAALPGDSTRFGNRAPIERAVAAFILPSLLPMEVDFVNANQWQLGYLEFDGRLNDLGKH